MEVNRLNANNFSSTITLEAMKSDVTESLFILQNCIETLRLISNSLQVSGTYYYQIQQTLDVLDAELISLEQENARLHALFASK